MTLIGKYVSTFTEATHALPEGMHMNADYPFMLPKIRYAEGGLLTIEGRGGEIATVEIKHAKHGEYAHIEQSSTFERIYGRKPTKFRLMPFKSEDNK